MQKSNMFTLTSGYNCDNSKFVNIKTGKVTPAEPILIWDKRREEMVKRHIRCQGYLYATFKNNVFATTKGGNKGWTEVIKKNESTYECWNPFFNGDKLLKVTFKIEGTDLHITTNLDLGDQIPMGLHSTIYGTLNVFSPIFKGVRIFLHKIAVRPDWATEVISEEGEIYYDKEYSREYAYGRITEGSFDPMQVHGVETADVTKVGRMYFFHLNGRYFSASENEYVYNDFYKDNNVLVLEYTGVCLSDEVVALGYGENCSAETTKKNYDKIVAAYGSTKMQINYNTPKEMTQFEAAVLDSALPLSYGLMSTIRRSEGDSNGHGPLRDRTSFAEFCFMRRGENANRHRAGLIFKEKVREGDAQLLCDIVHAEYFTYSDYFLDSEQTLETYFYVAKEAGHDMQKLLLEAAECYPRSWSDVAPGGKMK